MDRLRADAKAATRICKDLGMRDDLCAGAAARRTRRRRGGVARARPGAGAARQGGERRRPRLRLAQSQLGVRRRRRTAGSISTSCSPRRQTSSGRRISPGSRAAAPIRRPSCGATRDRVVACHVKDIAPAGQCLDEDGWADPGHGVLDWTALRAAMQEAGVKLFVVEHDKPSDVARFARRAAETIAQWA